LKYYNTIVYLCGSVADISIIIIIIIMVFGKINSLEMQLMMADYNNMRYCHTRWLLINDVVF